MAELMVFYCEQAAGFGSEYGFEDGGYFDALVRMFEQALKASVALPAEQRDLMLRRLAVVRRIGHCFGYGVGYGMDHLLKKYARHGEVPE